MNQILVNMQEEKEKAQSKSQKNRTNTKADIKSVIKVFCLIIIIMGISLAGKSVYAIASQKQKMQDNPQVNVERMGKEATISITTENPMKEVKYKWNEGEENVIKNNGTVSANQTIEIPNGNNILKITVTDYYGNKTYYQKQYIYESTDTTKPTIDIAKSGIKLKITASDDTEMAYMTYKWNDESETRIDATNKEKEITTNIEVKKGQNKLTITAVDSEYNKTTRTETVIGANKPTFTMSTDGKNIIVNAKDDDGVRKISITVDGVTTDSGETPLNMKEVTVQLPVTTGKHTIKVVVKNINSLEETQEITATI